MKNLDKVRIVKVGILGDNNFSDFKKIERILNTFIKKYKIQNLNDYFKNEIDTRFEFVIGRDNKLQKIIEDFSKKNNFNYEIINEVKNDNLNIGTFKRDAKIWETCHIGLFIAEFAKLEKNNDFSMKILTKLKRKVLLFDYKLNKYKYIH